MRTHSPNTSAVIASIPRVHRPTAGTGAGPAINGPEALGNCWNGGKKLRITIRTLYRPGGSDPRTNGVRDGVTWQNNGSISTFPSAITSMPFPVRTMSTSSGRSAIDSQAFMSKATSIRSPATGAPGVKNPGRSACPAATAGGHRVRRIKYTDPTDRERTDRGVRVALESSMPMRRRPGNGSLTRAFNIAALSLPVIPRAAIFRRASDIRNVRTVCTVCAAATAPVYGLSGSAFRWAGAQIRSLPPADAAAASTAAMSFARPRCASGRPRAIPDLLS